ncbi:MAG: hypothetical protein JWP40_2988 [Blastococcus sp.]|jgi:hypothetical protein|nr:hypothetical protein [Blastococcus sp.]
MFEVDWMGLLGREVLRERTAALVAEACAWTVGMSDQPHRVRRAGRLVATGLTVGERAAAGLPLSGEEDGRLDLGDARPGSFQDALNAVDRDGVVQADRFDAEVLEPFVRETCLMAADRGRRSRPRDWAELADDVGEDETDLVAVVAAAGWEAPLRIEAEHLVLAALGGMPLIEVEAEGLPLSLVRAAEAAARAAVRPPEPPSGTGQGQVQGQVQGDVQGEAQDDALAGARYLALTALGAARVTVPVAPEEARHLLAELLALGLEPEEVTAVLPDLPLAPGTSEAVAALLDARPPGG